MLGFNFKKEIKKRSTTRSKENMTSHVRKVLGAADQKLIVAVRG